MDKLRLPKLPAILIGIAISMFILVLGFIYLQGVPGRAEDQAPRDVVVSDITTNSVKINYATGIKTQGVVEYGVSPTALNSLAPEDESNINHEISLTLLSESTTYYFQIIISGKKYDNAGVPWTFSTKSTDSSLSTDVDVTISSRPTPISRVVIPNPESGSCTNEVDCNKIKAKLGKGCNTQDYIRCLKRGSNPTFAPLTTP